MELFNTVSCNEVIGKIDDLGCSFECCDREPQGLLQILNDNNTEINGTQITNGLTEIEASITIGMDSNQQFTCRAKSEICPMSYTIPNMCTVGSVLKLKCILVKDSSTCSHSQV